ncbi:pre-peptidase C-terminal domain-containing protein [Paenibacillus sp. yr247]|uniref:S8 family serine peptidase n=1 Tax=Paenibacillus sp. yr247 TaxID=1761880 RepID=UPI0008921B51|nr:S8 family serine peptidase [Paenibacillus sp. yr247]SDP07052.1 pre-peptidase C-terminal domain-containing protein [Paenibacillus sp. yr247]
MYWKKEKLFRIVVSIFVSFGMVVPVFNANMVHAADSTQVTSAKPRKSQITSGEQPVTNAKTDVNSHADGATASSDSQVLKQEYAPDSVIVKYKSNVAVSALSSPYAAEHVANTLPLTETGVQVLHLKDGTDISKVIADLKNDANVEYAEPDYKIYPANIPEKSEVMKSEVKMTIDQVLGQYANTPKPFIPYDPFFKEQWGLNNTGQTLYNGDAPAGTPGIDIDATEAWAVTQGSKDLVVAVIDSGVQTTLPDLYPNIWWNPHPDPQKNNQDIHGWDFVHNDGSLFDIKDKYSDYHGTWLASIIAASSNNGIGIAGVAPNVKIMPLKVMTNTGDIANVIKAIDYAQSHGAKIANIGWFTPGYSLALRDVIEHSPMLFVSAAGDHVNLNTDLIPVYPADFKSPNVLSVTAIDRGGNLAYGAAFGKSSVDVAAPGDYVITESPSNTIGYSAEIHKYAGPTNQEYKGIYNGVGFEEVPIREDLGMDPKQRQRMFDVAMDYLNQARGIDGKMKVLLVQDDNVSSGGGGDIGPFAADETLKVYTDLLDTYKSSHPLDYEIYTTPDQKADGPDLNKLNNYDVVIWFTGTKTLINQDVFLTKNDQDNLTTYLNNGGHLLLTGHNTLDGISESPFVLDTLHLVLMQVGSNGNPKTLAYPVPGTIYGTSKPFQLSDINLFTEILASDDPSITQVDIEWSRGYYRYNTGTDFAAAFATGTAALVLSQYPDMDAAAVKNKLMKSGKPLSALNGMTVSGRMINAFRALWDKDIPGTPLQDGTVSDKLDAASNPDKVYALDLKAGEQINLSLTGDAGTDFDLELYDSSATTVASKAGIVASSEHPGTSNEAITYTVPKSGTYYVDVFAFAGAGTFTLSILSRSQWGTFEDNDKALQYTGPWSSVTSPSYSGGKSMQLDGAGSVEFGFKGNTIEWIGSKGVNSGIADVYIDDIKVASPSLYSATPLTQQSLFKQSLGNGRHTIKIQWTGQHDKSSKKSDGAMINIDAFIVSNLFTSFDNSVSYQGIWGSGYSQKFTGGMQKFSVELNNSAEFSFTGTRVALLVNSGPSYGMAQIYIDGVLVTTDPVDWYSSKAKYQVTVFISPILASGDHKIKVVNIGQKNASSTGTVITIDAINVLN